MLRHSSIAITADTYTSVLPQVAYDAAESRRRACDAHERLYQLVSYGRAREDYCEPGPPLIC